MCVTGFIRKDNCWYLENPSGEVYLILQDDSKLLEPHHIGLSVSGSIKPRSTPFNEDVDYQQYSGYILPGTLEILQTSDEEVSFK